MRNQRGLTLIEALVVVALGAITVSATLIYSAPWLGRESMRSAANDLQAFLQLAKIEAVSRNRDCRVVLDTGSGGLEILDSLGTGDPADDTVLHAHRLPPAVRFERPDTGPLVTFADLGGGAYHAVFSSAGVVSAGAGAVYLRGGFEYGCVEVHGAGAVAISYWNGTGWVAGF
jgi:prepilin-type N-terminal cleavage/methylation domain-containing protein